MRRHVQASSIRRILRRAPALPRSHVSGVPVPPVVGRGGLVEWAMLQTMDMKLEVVVIPVSDVDRAKDFYTGLGWRLDANFVADDFRVVQLTPPGSLCSVIFGTGVTTAAPGSTQGLQLVVTDVEAARAELASHGVDVSEVFHDAGGVFHHAGTQERVSGKDPNGKSYASFVSFSDPDGNSWFVQEITTRLPGR